jgi:hypothetical protein
LAKPKIDPLLCGNAQLKISYVNSKQITPVYQGAQGYGLSGKKQGSEIL